MAEQEYRYENALKWIRTVAGMHYFGGAFEPEHMRALGNMAADALAGRTVKDFEEAMDASKQKASEWAARLGIELTGEDDG
jgi:hypothetical protein